MIEEKCTTLDQLKEFLDRGKADLRDQFAMAALTGFMANLEWVKTLRNEHGNVSSLDIAKHMYMMADAMIERRQTPSDSSNGRTADFESVNLGSNPGSETKS